MKKYSGIVGLAGLALGTAAYAQPTAANLGNVNHSTTLNVMADVLTSGEPVWFTFTVTEEFTAGSGVGLAIGTEAGGLGDTEIGLFRADGSLVESDDDDGPGLMSRLSFGTGSCLDGAPSGADLPTGVYYLAVGDYNMEFSDNFTVTTGIDTGSNNVYLRTSVADAPSAAPYNEQTPLHDLTGTAEELTGTGAYDAIIGSLNGEADMYKIRINDLATFAAYTVCTDTTMDTQLFLFNEDGLGVAVNDDNVFPGIGLQSHIPNSLVNATGNYYLAVSGYNLDPVDGTGQLLWINTPFASVRAPDGPGAGNAVSSWAPTGAVATGSYTIRLRGVTGTGGGGPTCVADFDDGSFTGTRDGAVTVDDLLYYLDLFGNGDVRADVDNGTSTGTQDQAVTIDDLLYFLVRFDLGC